MQQKAAHGHIENGIHLDWEPVQAWLEEVFTKERLAEIGLTAVTLGILGWLLFVFYKAMENYQVVGSGFF